MYVSKPVGPEGLQRLLLYAVSCSYGSSIRCTRRQDQRASCWWMLGCLHVPAHNFQKRIQCGTWCIVDTKLPCLADANSLPYLLDDKSWLQGFLVSPFQALNTLTTNKAPHLITLKSVITDVIRELEDSSSTPLQWSAMSWRGSSLRHKAPCRPLSFFSCRLSS